MELEGEVEQGARDQRSYHQYANVVNAGIYSFELEAFITGRIGLVLFTLIFYHIIIDDEVKGDEGD